MHYSVLLNMIVLCDKYGSPIRNTGWQQFARSDADLVYVVMALNWINAKYHFATLADIAYAWIVDFLSDYQNATKPDGSNRGAESLKKCTGAVCWFFAEVAKATNESKYTVDALINTVAAKDPHGALHVLTTPQIKLHATPTNVNRNLQRDIPPEVYKRLCNIAKQYDPMIYFAIVAQANTGMRPSEVLNLCQVDSPMLAKNYIRFVSMDGHIMSASIVMEHESVMRSDGVDVGGIKKPRIIPVHPHFLPELVVAYNFHLQILAKYDCEDAYRPMFLDRNGMAMTYASYLRRFTALVDRYLIPELLSSGDPNLIVYGRSLGDKTLSPHALRHYFSVRLVDELNLSIPEIMSYRGDKSPDSALHYLANKQVLVDDAKRIAAIGLDNIRNQR